ncbi:MAG: MucR family transcriptional regulator [Alphaproteobacteria bacterium]|jgi:predicted transcriptional regulator|nr:MucR family transcriptional regulator [Alphaproteobacteria bacterium]
MTEGTSPVDVTARLVAAYASNNRLMPQDLPGLIQAVHSALLSLSNGGRHDGGGGGEPLKPAVSIKKSVTGDYIICLEDGLKFKSLKRHLRSSYKMTPEEYRSKWGLPHDYPMVAPSYAAHRSRLAKQIGLGRKRSARRK